MVQKDDEQADFIYGGARDSAGLPARVAIFADLGETRREIAEDLVGAGFRAVDGGELGVLLDGPITLLGDVVVVDCRMVDPAILAALTRLDMRASQSGAQLVVSTSLEALDEVFAALDQSQPHILVEPSRADRVIAVGRLLAGVSNVQVREMGDEDRLKLLHLAQQVETIAQELDRITQNGAQRPGDDDESDKSGVSDFAHEWRGPEHSPSIVRKSAPYAAKPQLPDPRIVRQIIANRQVRTKFFDAELFSDPAWNMLLDLTAAHSERSQVSVTSLCIAAGVPATTALRWIKQLVESGIFERVADTSDKRRAFIALSERSVEAMALYFAEVSPPLAQAA